MSGSFHYSNLILRTFHAHCHPHHRRSPLLLYKWQVNCFVPRSLKYKAFKLILLMAGTINNVLYLQRQKWNGSSSLSSFRLYWHRTYIKQNNGSFSANSHLSLSSAGKKLKHCVCNFFLFMRQTFRTTTLKKQVLKVYVKLLEHLRSIYLSRIYKPKEQYLMPWCFCAHEMTIWASVLCLFIVTHIPYWWDYLDNYRCIFAHSWLYSNKKTSQKVNRKISCQLFFSIIITIHTQI